MRKRVDLGDVAERVGVSKSTVHYALYQPDRLGAETLDKVLTVVRELGYRPNLLARSLRTRRTFTIGVITPFLGNYTEKVFAGLEMAAEDNRYTVFLGYTRGQADREREVVESFMERAMEGLIILPAEGDENAGFFRSLQQEEFPFAFAEHSFPGVNVDSVGTDDLLGGKLATRHLIRQGCSKIAFVPPPAPTCRHNWVLRRLEGCNLALGEAGLPPAGEIVLGTVGETTHHRYAHAAVADSLRQGEEFDGVFAANDELAWGAMEALAEAGRQPGQEVAVIGFDDLDPSAYLSVPLTSLRHPFAAIGNEAFRLLLRRIEKSGDLAVQHILLEPMLVVRQSCGESMVPGQ
ncbi:MAG: LacI family transcriptional regulator [candidate division WS1 bacterium]|nr:LacI family transcriptional regulator [candidate division WS1 bacterium]